MALLKENIERYQKAARNFAIANQYLAELRKRDSFVDSLCKKMNHEMKRVIENKYAENVPANAALRFDELALRPIQYMCKFELFLRDFNKEMTQELRTIFGTAHRQSQDWPQRFAPVQKDIVQNVDILNGIKAELDSTDATSILTVKPKRALPRPKLW